MLLLIFDRAVVFIYKLAARKPPSASPARVTPVQSPFAVRPAVQAQPPVVNQRYDPASVYAPSPARKSVSKDSNNDR